MQRLAYLVRRRSPLRVVRRHRSQDTSQLGTDRPGDLWATTEPGERNLGRDAGKCPLTRSKFEQDQGK